MSRLLTITIEVHKQASKLASSPHYLHYKHLSYTLYSVPPHDVLIGLGSDHLHKLLYSLIYANPPFRATSRRSSGLMAANPFGTFAFPPRLCAARLFSGLYLRDANP